MRERLVLKQRKRKPAPVPVLLGHCFPLAGPQFPHENTGVGTGGHPSTHLGRVLCDYVCLWQGVPAGLPRDLGDTGFSLCLVASGPAEAMATPTIFPPVTGREACSVWDTLTPRRDTLTSEEPCDSQDHLCMEQSTWRQPFTTDDS